MVAPQRKSVRKDSPIRDAKASREPPYTVHGVVKGTDGRELSGAEVAVFWQRIRERRELARGRTSEEGEYSLNYRPPDEAPSPLLIFVVVHSPHIRAPLESVLTPAESDLQIDLEAQPSDTSEFAMLTRAIEPLLDGLPLTDVVENDDHHDVTFLATETGKTIEEIMRVVVSARLHAAYDAPAEAFYAFLRLGVPSGLPSPLLSASQDFALINPLVQHIGSLIFALPGDVQQSTLQKAIQQQLIRQTLKDEISKILSQFQSLRSANLLDQPYAVGKTTLAQLLDSAQLAKAKQTAFAQALSINTQRMNVFWNQLADGQHGFTSEEIASVRQTLEIGAFVKNQIPLIQTLTQKFASGTFSSMADLAKLSEQDWLQLITQTGPEAVPANITSAGGANPSQVFAQEIYHRITLAYPTSALAGRIATGNFAPQNIQAPLGQFFSNNPQLDLRRHNVEAYLQQQGENAWVGIIPGDQAQVLASVKSMQRVLRITPHVDTAQTMLSLGIDSSAQITMMGKQQFANKLTAAGISDLEAGKVYCMAEQRYATLVSAISKYNMSVGIGIWPKAFGPFGPVQDAISSGVKSNPSLTTLFGSQSFCEVDDCTSVLSPAAYLTDLLLWLRYRAPAVPLKNPLPPIVPNSPNNPLAVLFNRRPDIGNLLLNCPNSETELPYIDLVNEILEDAVAPPPPAIANPFNNSSSLIDAAGTASNFTSGTLYTVNIGCVMVNVSGGSGVSITVATDSGAVVYDAVSTLSGAFLPYGWTIKCTYNSPPKTTVSLSKQTTLSEEQLRAAPQYINHAAYDKLALAGYPHSLPYDGPLDEIRTYLQQSNVALWQLRLNLQPVEGITPIAQAASTAAERFQISPHELELITTANSTVGTLNKVWGLPATADPATYLATVSNLLEAADITYEQMLELLDVVWIRAGGSPMMLQGLSDKCDVTSETISPLDYNRLDRMHRFLRLWRRTSLKMWELDLLLTAPAIANNVLDENAIVSLFNFQLLLDATKLSVDQLLAFFQNIDTSSHRNPDGTYSTSSYAQLFQNPTVPADAAFVLSTLLASASSPPNILDPSHPEHLDAVCAALQVSAADATTLVNGLTNGQLTLDNLSLLHRVSTLATAVNLSIADLLRTPPPATGQTQLQAISSVFTKPSATLAFIQRVNAIRQSGFTIDMMSYVLTTSPTLTGVTDKQVQGYLVDVKTAMQKVHDDIYGSKDSSLTILGRELAQMTQLSDPALLATAISIVNGTFTGTAADFNNFIATNFVSFMDVPTAEQELALPLQSNPNDPAAVQAEVNQRAQKVLDPLFVYLTTTQVIATVARDMQLAADVTNLLMRNLNVYGTSLTLLNVLTDPSMIGSSSSAITPGNFPNQYYAVHLLDKVGTVVRQLHLVLSDLQWLLSNPSLYGGVDLTQLPVQSTQPSLSFDSLLTTVLLVKLARAFSNAATSTATPPPPIQSLYQLISAIGNTATTDSSAQSALATITGWVQDDIQAFAVALGISLSKGDYVRPAVYDRLRTLIAMAEVTSGSGKALVSWGALDSDEIVAASALQALKSRYSADSWLQVAPAIIDPIRENREAALVGYLLAQLDANGNPIWGTSADDLFNVFLIDAQMTSCMLTSRIVQAYGSVQIFVQRCLMNLEGNVTIDPTNTDDGWAQWKWMDRYRPWEANREVFLFPENLLIETTRPSSTDIFQKLEQDAHQVDNTADNFETVTLNYIDRLDQIAHLHVTGTCVDQADQTIYVVARTKADPPQYYFRSLEQSGTWTTWQLIQLDIKAHEVVPVVYRRHLYIFWPQVKTAKEPQQQMPAASVGGEPTMSDSPAQHVEITICASAFQNGGWSPVQQTKSKLYDISYANLDRPAADDSRTIEELYSIKTQVTVPDQAGGSYLYVDVFRLGQYTITQMQDVAWPNPFGAGGKAHIYNYYVPIQNNPADAAVAVHIGRAIFDGRFNELKLRADLDMAANGEAILGSNGGLVQHAQNLYGPDAADLLPLLNPMPTLNGDWPLVPRAGGLKTDPEVSLWGGSDPPTIPLKFAPTGPQEQDVGPLLNTAPVPFSVVGSSVDYEFDPTSYFFFSDKKRSYFVEADRYYEYGSQWRPVTPSDPANTPFEMRYVFHRFYHPYTSLFWHELSSGGFPALFDRSLQLNPSKIDKTNADNFSFSATYAPVQGRVHWGEDYEIIDFSPSAAYSAYNWEIFFHLPFYLAGLLNQNQQFEDARTWYHYIFNPTKPGTDPVPQRYWNTAPLYNLTSAEIVKQNINQFLILVNHQDVNAKSQVDAWRKDPFDPFLIADMRPVAYMKAVIMSYLDNLIAWGDNLFATNSREALNEATLMYTLAAEILGPQPTAVPPPSRLDQTYNQLEPLLDAFANAMVAVENFIPSTGPGAACSGGQPSPSLPTFYFKIPPNQKLLGYWSTVGDRLFKLRHCQNIEGVTEQLALFDAPIDPELLIQAEAAGVDLGSVLNDTGSPPPNYRFATMYNTATDFCTAVRTYASQLLSALSSADAAKLAMLLTTTSQQLLKDQDDIYQAKVDQAQAQIDALNQTLGLYQQRYQFYSSQPFTNEWEAMSLNMNAAWALCLGGIAVAEMVAAGSHLLPDVFFGAAGFGGTPSASAKEGGSKIANSSSAGANAGKALALLMEKIQATIDKLGTYHHRQDSWVEAAAEAQIQIAQTQAQITAAQAVYQMAQTDQANHKELIDNLQKQIDFLMNKFTNEDLYDWMVSQLSAVYFKSYNLAYNMAKKAERCYRYELGLLDSSFISFGYWDSLEKGLMAGENLQHDLRRMQDSYLELNVRRYEVGRFISLRALSPQALIQLLETGECDFDIPEVLFDLDYPGQYQRRITRVSLTVVYPNAGRFTVDNKRFAEDNVKCKLTLTKNSVRLTTDVSSGYARTGPNDPHFTDQFGAIGQSIVTGNAQDDPGLFVTHISANVHDLRYLPFEGAGVISSWHLEMRQENNEIDLSTVGDIQLHFYYTALEGGDTFKQAVQNDSSYTQGITTIQPTQSQQILLLSAQKDFATAWSNFLNANAGNDQTLTLPLTPLNFPPWAREKTIMITGLTIYAVSPEPSNFVLEPQTPEFVPPLPGPAPSDITLTSLSSPPPNAINVASASITPLSIPPQTMTFKLKQSAVPVGPTQWQQLTNMQIGDVILMIAFTAT